MTPTATDTTIRVSTELRDVLKAQAALRGATLSQHLQALADGEQRRLRFEELKAAMEANPPDKEYLREMEEWQSDAW